MLIRKERRNYRKRRHKNSATRGGLAPSGVSTSTAASLSVASTARGLSCFSDAPSVSSEDEVESAVLASHSEADEAESDVEKQGPFTFRRKLHCSYLAVSFVEASNQGLLTVRDCPHSQYTLFILIPLFMC